MGLHELAMKLKADKEKGMPYREHGRGARSRAKYPFCVCGHARYWHNDYAGVSFHDCRSYGCDCLDYVPDETTRVK